MQLIISYWTLIFKHFWMFLEKIWQYIRMLFDWLLWIFSVSWNYEFISLFSNLFLIFFVIWIAALILSHLFWDNDIIKEWIWNNKNTSTLSLSIKWIWFVIIFLFSYFAISDTLWKIVINVQWIKEQWFVLNAKEEWFENESWEELDKKMKMTWWFLNDINLDSWMFDQTSSDYNYVFREISLKHTKINFSPEYSRSSWKTTINYSMAKLNWNILETNRWKINMFYVQDFLRSWVWNLTWVTIPKKAKEKTESNCYWKLDNITNYWQDVYSMLINNHPKIAQEIRESIFVQDSIRDLTDIYSNIKNNYIVTSSNSLEDLMNSENQYKSIVENLICIENQNESWYIQLTQSDNNNVEDNTNIEHIEKILKHLKKYLLFLERFTEENNKEITKDDNKFLFILQALWWEWAIWQNIESMIDRDLKSTEYIQLTRPFIIDIENWDKLINYWICYHYIFNSKIESDLKSNWMYDLVQILKSWCWKNFWWVYDYVENDIDRLWVQSYKKIINQIDDSKDSNNEISWKHSWYQNYWNYVWDDAYQLKTNDNDIKPEFNSANEYKHRIRWISWIIKWINIYKNIIFSLFLYILPWVFIVLLLKFIKLTSNGD